ncbi:MAG: ABC transporter permease [Planctomycetota bacterium]
MYKLLLCWRYLKTRYIALASIISVTLGVATMIVVNSVMAGFAREMENRIHGVLADLTLEARSLDGALNAEAQMAKIMEVAGSSIEALTPTVFVPALVNYEYGGNTITHQVDLVGIDETRQAKVSDFGTYLQHPANRERFEFRLRDGGYDTRDHQGGPKAVERPQMARAGWQHRREMAEARAFQQHFETQQGPPPLGTPYNSQAVPESPAAAGPQQALPPTGLAAEESNSRMAIEVENAAGRGDPRSIAPPPPLETGTRLSVAESVLPTDPFARLADSLPSSDPFAARGMAAEPQRVFNPMQEQHTGAVVGIALASFRSPEGKDRFLLLPGDDVRLTFPTVGTPPKASYDEFTVVDFYESKMSEYDSRFVFVPIRKLQELRGMIDPTTRLGLFNAIQIKLKPGEDGTVVRDKLRAAFPPEVFAVFTWRDKQGALLAAVQMETAILNVLLFLIIAVAGFGILAIFYMIVVEKTRDVGVLKALGAPASGVMGIFLSYGLSLGIVGSGAGLVLGLLFVHYINEIAEVLGWITGHKVFDPAIYYFYSIPAVVEVGMVAWVVAGALLIAVAASVLPARRAARLHPVEALRYE